MPVTTTVLALGTAVTGHAAVLAAAASDSSGLAPWVQGGGSAAAVAGLVYVARMIVRGELVPRPVKDTENEMGAAIMAQAQREAASMKIAEQSLAQTQVALAQTTRLADQHDRTLIALEQSTQSAREVAEEMQYWREMRNRGTRQQDSGPNHREEQP